MSFQNLIADKTLLRSIAIDHAKEIEEQTYNRRDQPETNRCHPKKVDQHWAL